MNLFQSTLQKKNTARPPVWFMRQAGRYHSHYQKLKERHSFIEICKIPEVACEATMGPIRDFDFDAAILFSDLLFPLEAMGMDDQISSMRPVGGRARYDDDRYAPHPMVSNDYRRRDRLQVDPLGRAPMRLQGRREDRAALLECRQVDEKQLVKAALSE